MKIQEINIMIEKNYSRHTRKNKCITKDTTKGGEIWKVLKILIGMLKIS